MPLGDAEPVGDAGPLLVLNEVERPALVLGSTQREADVDVRALDHGAVQLARRRSGGGAVLLEPGAHTWIDVELPGGDRRWLDDVERATWWLGEAWAATLDAASPGQRAQVHREGLVDRRAGRIACFAASGPGEVEVRGAKVVGISQRRTRGRARFQTVVHHRWEPERTLELLDGSVRSVVERPLRDRVRAAAGFERIEPGWAVLERLVTHLG